MEENSLGETFGGGGRGCLEIGRWWGDGDGGGLGVGTWVREMRGGGRSEFLLRGLSEFELEIWRWG